MFKHLIFILVWAITLHLISISNLTPVSMVVLSAVFGGLFMLALNANSILEVYK